MPKFDGTGPRGLGPLTGQRNGTCASHGRGMLKGLFGCRRFCRRGICTENESDVIQMDFSTLKETEQALEAELEIVRKARKSQEEK